MKFRKQAVQAYTHLPITAWLLNQLENDVALSDYSRIVPRLNLAATFEISSEILQSTDTDLRKDY